MIVDASVLAAILFKEPTRPRILELMAGMNDLKISSSTLLEITTVTYARLGENGVAELRHLLAAIGCQEIPFGDDHREAAEYGYFKFGKGRHQSPSALNFGDCFTYGLAKATGEPLLFIGDDFNRTDLTWIDLDSGELMQRPSTETPE